MSDISQTSVRVLRADRDERGGGPLTPALKAEVQAQARNEGAVPRRIVERGEDGLAPVLHLHVEGVLVMLASADVVAAAGQRPAQSTNPREGVQPPLNVVTAAWGAQRVRSHPDVADVSYALAWDEARRAALVEAIGVLLAEYGLSPLDDAEAD